MTYAPPDLLAVQRYARAKTAQTWASLGIVGDQSHNSTGGYHVGHDVLHALGAAPEDPGSDYSYTESSRDRDGLTDAASAFDLGGNFPRFLQFNAWIVGRAKAGDPRCRDIREIIHTLDGRTVRRWDALGVRSSGDSSHLTHTHFSFFRDSEGRRASADNVLGLLAEFFDGPTEVPDMNLGDEFAIPTWNDPEFKAPEKTTVQTALAVAQRRSYQAWQNAVGARNDIKGLAGKVDQLAAQIGQPAPVALSEADRAAIAAQVLAQMPKPPTAAEIADELARRIGNG